MDKIFNREPMAVLIAREIDGQGFYSEEPINKNAQKGYVDLEVYHNYRPLFFGGKERRFLASLKAEECDAFACSSLSLIGNQGDKEMIERIANRLIEKFGFYKVSIILKYDGPGTDPLGREAVKTCAFA